jgi:hypothetical protein
MKRVAVVIGLAFCAAACATDFDAQSQSARWNNRSGDPRKFEVDSAKYRLEARNVLINATAGSETPVMAQMAANRTSPVRAI